MNVNDFDFDLPAHLIAQTPLAERTASRMLVLGRASGQIEHRQFVDLVTYLRPGDLLVMNDTRVLPARLYGVKPDTGAAIELLLLRNISGHDWRVLVKPAKRLRAGSVVFFSEELKATVLEEHEHGERTVRFACQGVFMEVLAKLGEMPLPPYIREKLQDQERYQTVYAREQGSAAAPTAGLHFTETYLERLKSSGIQLGFVTLHVGLGTFRPVSAERVEDHTMHSEYYVVPDETAALIQRTKSSGGRVIAIGTTSARTLETMGQQPAFAERGPHACSGWSDIFIYPGYQFRVIDGLFTNFHLPKSTLVMMVSALAGRDPILRAYRSAVEQEYRFFSFGDCMLIL